MDFKKIKNLFVVETESEQNSSIPSTKKNDETTSTEKKTTPQPNINQTPGVGNFDQKIFDSLIKVLEEKNMPGEDYMEFIEALQNMKNIPLDETVKMQTVLATLSTKGLTKQKIIESADFYIQVLQDEKNKFNEALKQETNKQVESKLNDIKNIEEQNKKKTEQIAQLTNEINQNQQQINTIKSSVDEAAQKIKNTESNFNFTFEAVISQIKNNSNKIKTI